MQSIHDIHYIHYTHYITLHYITLHYITLHYITYIRTYTHMPADHALTARPTELLEDTTEEQFEKFGGGWTSNVFSKH